MTMFLFQYSSPLNPVIYSSFSTTTFPCSFFRRKTSSTPIVRKTLTHPIISCFSATITNSIPARDRIIDFGKHRGKMLGSLPSHYLKWVSNNLRARDFQDWANLADEVLQDPVYKDRLEWEFAQRLLNGDVSSSSSRSESPASDLAEISQRFGWDNDDKVGWSRVNFELLGTSNGARIPRVCGGGNKERVRASEGEKRRVFRVCDGGEEMGGEKRTERRERVRSKSKMMMKLRMDDDDDDDEVMFQRNQETHQDRTVEIYNPFPGRESLLKKVLNRKRLL